MCLGTITKTIYEMRIDDSFSGDHTVLDSLHFANQTLPIKKLDPNDHRTPRPKIEKKAVVFSLLHSNLSCMANRGLTNAYPIMNTAYSLLLS